MIGVVWLGCMVSRKCTTDMRFSCCSRPNNTSGTAALRPWNASGTWAMLSVTYSPSATLVGSSSDSTALHVRLKFSN